MTTTLSLMDLPDEHRQAVLVWLGALLDTPDQIDLEVIEGANDEDVDLVGVKVTLLKAATMSPEQQP